MIKSREISDPNSCLNRAKDDEFVFVLLEHDAAFSHAIREWAKKRIEIGKNKPEDPQIIEALRGADTAEGKQLLLLEKNGRNGHGNLPSSGEEVVQRAWSYYHQKTEKTRAYELTDKRKKQGLSRYRWALKRTGSMLGAMKLMRAAIDAMAASKWHMDKGFTSWDKNLFKSDEQFQEWIERAEREGLIG